MECLRNLIRLLTIKKTVKSPMKESVVLWTLLLTQAHAASVDISVVPSGAGIATGGQVSVQCSLQGASSGNLFWYRRQGDISYQLGADDLVTLNNGDVGGNRYSLEQVQTSDSSRTYKLTVSDARLEDTATIECRLSSDRSVAASTAIAVCSDPFSTYCSCMMNEGWSSPHCYTSKLDEQLFQAVETSWSVVVGLIIALVVTFSYAVVLILILKRDYLRKCCEDGKEEEEIMLSGRPESEDGKSQQVDISDSTSDSPTCSTSDPSSSAGSYSQGSTQFTSGSNDSAKKIFPNPMKGEDNWTLRNKPRKAETTSFILKPELHHNEGYVSVHDFEAKPSTHQERSYEGNHEDSHEGISKPITKNHPRSSTLHADHTVGVGFNDLCQDRDNICDLRSTNNPSVISTVSRLIDAEKDQSQRKSLGSTYPSLLDIAGTEI